MSTGRVFKMYRHFVLDYDPNFDYESICRQLFYDEWLCVVEKIDINAHCHFQGKTNLAADTFRKHATALTQGHYKRAVEGARPLRHKKSPADATGFQYMMKATDTVLSTSFDQEKLDELRQASTDHVTDLKERCKRVVLCAVDSAVSRGKHPMDVMDLATDAMCEYYESIDKPIPVRHADFMILGWILRHAGRGTPLYKFVKRRVFKCSLNLQ